MEIKLIQATDPQAYGPLLTGWFYRWWGEKEGWSRAKVEMYVSRSFQQDSLPLTLMAFSGKDAVGTCQLSMQDLDVRPDYYPWLVNLFVVEGSRRRGVAAALIQEAIKKAEQLGFPELYLYTELDGFYEKFGFERLETADVFLPQPQHIYRKRLHQDAKQQ